MFRVIQSYSTFKYNRITDLSSSCKLWQLTKNNMTVELTLKVAIGIVKPKNAKLIYINLTDKVRQFRMKPICVKSKPRIKFKILLTVLFQVERLAQFLLNHVRLSQLLCDGKMQAQLWLLVRKSMNQ
ncbi:unnamed protein product (macronuclear) [Paramecium tetraurelia]|uniref:Uncharacterized protein n=1 Tax=Paramecium tetraurelia TaxID=5888 RepID=A0E2Z7_PARTE|nr:uncharacterized protein GSPATT00022836001 [Paramecium tetraurelia]CAK89664.1 unnamed protein product [Paramecium tetraurelia]|eukprot:XP_001457061.1 hypothetical protein (macronuclear) [Paramecium tetraurelia strain d4-2]